MKKVKISLLILCSLLLFSCSEDVGCKEKNDCIFETIASYDNHPRCGNGGLSSVKKFSFQNQTVFVLEHFMVATDAQTPVLNERCEEIGALGGLMGNTTVNGEDFANAVFVETVWEKQE